MSQLRVGLAAFMLMLGALAPAGLTAQTTDPVGPDSVVYTSRGRVVFYHNRHGEKFECASCHHEDKADKPYERPRQRCADCHTDPPVAPVLTTLRNAMHDTEARTGLCFDCHKTEGEKGVEVPTRCVDCHKREPGGSRP